MPKLPSNLVRPAPPVFDNPLRRTTAPSTSSPELAEGSTDDHPVVDAAIIALPLPPVAPTAPSTDAANLNARITVRIDDSVFVALQTECYQRRIRGEKTNVAELAREILGSWAQRRS